MIGWIRSDQVRVTRRTCPRRILPQVWTRKEATDGKNVGVLDPPARKKTEMENSICSSQRWLEARSNQATYQTNSSGHSSSDSLQLVSLLPALDCWGRPIKRSFSLSNHNSYPSDKNTVFIFIGIKGSQMINNLISGSAQCFLCVF